MRHYFPGTMNRIGYVWFRVPLFDAARGRYIIPFPKPHLTFDSSTMSATTALLGKIVQDITQDSVYISPSEDRGNAS